MGNTQTHGLQHQVVSSLRKETGFTYSEISDLYRQFRIDAHDSCMTLEHFQSMYKEVFPHGEPDKLAEKIFATFDKRQSGKVDFHDFLNTLSVQLKGTIKMKYEWVYDVISHNGTVTVTKGRIQDMITTLNNLYAGLLPEEPSSPEELCDLTVRCIISQPGVTSGSDVISKKDFVNAAMLTSTVRQLTEAVVKAAMMPYEVRRERTGSIGRPRSDSMRARSLSSQGGRQQTRSRRTNTIS